MCNMKLSSQFKKWNKIYFVLSFFIVQSTERILTYVQFEFGLHWIWNSIWVNKTTLDWVKSKWYMTYTEVLHILESESELNEWMHKIKKEKGVWKCRAAFWKFGINILNFIFILLQRLGNSLNNTYMVWCMEKVKLSGEKAF